MTVPTEEEFHSSLVAFAAPIPPDLIEQFDVRMFRNADPSMALALIKSMLTKDWEQLREAWETPGGRWLKGDLMIKRAETLITRGFVPTTLDEMAERFYGRVKERMYGGESTSALRWHTIQATKDAHDHFSRHWPLILLHAFHEYHYKPESVLESAQAERRLRGLEETVKAGIEANRLLKIAALPKKPTFPSLYVDDLKAIDEHRDSDLRRLSRNMESALSELSPIKRNDKTAHERQLVYRLWAGHSDILYRRRVRAIHLILLVGGVKHQIDERNVEKMCAAFKKNRSGDAFRYTRRLLVGIRGDNYRSEMRALFDDSSREESIAKIGPQLPLP